eukprot:4145868-Prymnesium_polylepis.1
MFLQRIARMPACPAFRASKTFYVRRSPTDTAAHVRTLLTTLTQHTHIHTGERLFRGMTRDGIGGGGEHHGG